MAQTSPLQSLLKQHFGYSEFRPHQEEIIKSVLAGEDVFALLPTGGGKSLCFQLPALAAQGLTLVISPLIALMKDQVDALLASGIPATFLNSSIDRKTMRERVEELDRGKFKLLYVAPERIVLKDFLERVERWNVKLIAIDEAHCISEWGHDFRPEYGRIPELRELLPKVPMLALTATATARVRADIVQLLKLRHPKIFVASFNRPNLTYRVAARDEASEQVIQFIQERPSQSGIVYCFSRKGAEEMAGDLKAAGIKALPYHAGLSADERTRHQEAFLRDNVQVICATIAFGMGINKSNVRFVIHRDLPKNVEGYYQETGRAGRDGLRSDCLLLFSRSDAVKIARFIDEKEEAEKKIAQDQLDEMMRYAESPACRRAYLLHYFGEKYPEENCGSCDNCLQPRAQFEATVPAKKFLSCVYRIYEKSGFNMGLNHVMQVLVGADTEAIRKHGHHQVSTYGIGKELRRDDWMNIGRELVRLGYLEQNPEKFNAASLTADGRQFLTDKDVSLMLLKSAEQLSSKVTAPMDAPYDRGLFEKLRELRKRVADELDVPAYIIFSDVTLQDIARKYPVSEVEFRRVVGVGERKLQDFGAAFLTAVKEFLVAHPRQEFFIASVRKRARIERLKGTVGITVEMFKNGSDVKEIAKTRSLVESTVFAHLERAIERGTVLPRERFFTAKQWGELKRVFENYQGSLSPLHELLNGRYSYDELRMFRTLNEQEKTIVGK